MTTVEEAGRKGGLRTKETHDHEFFVRLGTKGGKATARNIRENGISPERRKKLSEGGRKGGAATRKKYGREFYQEMGRKGGSTPRQA